MSVISDKAQLVTISGVMAAALIGAIPPAIAQPIVLEETTRLASPDPQYRFGGSIAIEGNDLLVTATAEGSEDWYGLFHFERQPDGSWVSRGRVAAHGVGDTNRPSEVVLESGVAVFASDRRDVTVLERTPTGWITTPLQLPDTYASGVRIANGTIAIGGVVHGGDSVIYLVEKNSSGTWGVVDVLEGAPSFEDNDYLGPDIEFVGTQAIAVNSYWDYSAAPQQWRNETHVFDRIGGAWQRTAILDRELQGVPMDGQIALRTGADREAGEILFLDTRDSTGAWTVRSTLNSEESFANVAPRPVLVRGDRAYAGAPANDLRGEGSGSVNVFERTSAGRFEHVASLAGSDAMTVPVYRGSAQALGGAIAVDGTTVAALGYTAPDPNGNYGRAIYLYELPDPLPQAARVQDTFEDINAAGWMPWGSTDWSVMTSAGSYVYRQADNTGGARAILNSPVTENQAIEADVKVDGLFGPSPWAGLMVRYVDALNHYYLMVGYNNTIQIRRNINGVFGPIASAPFNLTLGRTYRLRLEAVGTWLRAYVDGQLVLETQDTSHTQGRAALAMWKARADYDNVIVSTSPRTELLADSFSQTDEENLTPWALSPEGAWSYATVGGATVLRQSLIEGGQRAVNGAPAGDQIIAADIRPTAFHYRGTGWAGLIARRQDALNYYYVLLTDTDTASLRKLVNGRAVVLDEVPMTVTLGTSYRVRLEAIGTSLRLYVNGRLMAEAEDSDYSTGRYGLATYRAAANYDSFSAVRP